MSKSKTKEKQRLLIELIEAKVFLCEDISHLIFKPMSYFDWDKVAQLVKEKQTEVNNS